MNQDQINSLVRSLLKIAGSVLVAHGLTVYASLINTEDVAGLLIGLVGIYESHRTHADPLLKAIADFAAGPVETGGQAARSPEAQLTAPPPVEVGLPLQTTANASPKTT